MRISADAGVLLVSVEGGIYGVYLGRAWEMILQVTAVVESTSTTALWVTRCSFSSMLQRRRKIDLKVLASFFAHDGRLRI